MNWAVDTSMFKSIYVRVFQLRHELAWVVTGQLLAFLGGFAGIKILTNVLGPEGYGQLALGLTIAGLLNMFVYGPIGQVVLRFFSVYRERGELSIYFTILKNAHITSAVLLVVCDRSRGCISSVVVWDGLGHVGGDCVPVRHREWC